MQQNTWKISQIHDGETIEAATGASRDEALRAIRVAMYGEADVLSAASAESVHDLPLAA
jgi:hypothetical protein